MEIIDRSFTNSDTEFNLIKEFLFDVETYPDFDNNWEPGRLVIVNPQGESVAYCMGWIKEHQLKSGYIEPLGTHPGYRRNGFGTALAKECFKRLFDRGVERVSIASNAEPDVANFLYESLGPAGIKRAYRYSVAILPTGRIG